MQTRNKAASFSFHAIGLAVALVSLFPLFWMVLAGFKSKREVLAFPFKFLPTEWVTTNYATLFETGTFIRAMGITLLGAIIFAVCGLVINSMAAFVFARLDFPLKNILWIYVIMTMFIPWMAIMTFLYRGSQAEDVKYALGADFAGAGIIGQCIFHQAILFEYT